MRDLVREKVIYLFIYGFLTLVTMMNIMFQDFSSCILVIVYLRENVACLLSSLFETEDGGNTFNRNVSNLLPGYTASYLGNSIHHFILFSCYITHMAVLSQSVLLCIIIVRL